MTAQAPTTPSGVRGADPRTISLAAFASPHVVLGCGIDSERIDRFDRILASDPHPMPFVFAAAEIVHARAMADPSAALAASFCCKEALRKAWREPLNLCDFVMLYLPGQEVYDIDLPESLRTGCRVREIRAEVHSFHCVPPEMVATVFLLGPGGSHE